MSSTDSESLKSQILLGNIFTLLGALTAYFLSIILPLVGRAGAATVHYRANFLTFLGVLLLAIGFSAAGWWFKLKRREVDGSPYPLVSAGFTVVYLLLLAVLLLGGLKI